jgi:hypothetical protein
VIQSPADTEPQGKWRALLPPSLAELLAMAVWLSAWTWMPAFLLASFRLFSGAERWAGVAAFAVIAMGGPGSLIGGKLADQCGRTAITIGSLAISGACALGIGALHDHGPVLLTAVALVWGFAVVAGSAQFSTSVSELAEGVHHRHGTDFADQSGVPAHAGYDPTAACPSESRRLGMGLRASGTGAAGRYRSCAGAATIRRRGKTGRWAAVNLRLSRACSQRPCEKVMALCDDHPDGR